MYSQEREKALDEIKYIIHINAMLTTDTALTNLAQPRRNMFDNPSKHTRANVLVCIALKQQQPDVLDAQHVISQILDWQLLSGLNKPER